ncbi:MFS transporter [Actinophytocola sp.]|uniref:MFS transporter n=1 Tax=Actinophytocola sp. TaxID=1872138 RepID=UPI002D7FD6E0|nr:MFS transporter [Actinophytocola sp.]HET9140732.1 MFS transporter [Actinophytocola sp.]
MPVTGLHRNLKLRIGVGFVQKFLDAALVPLMVIHFTKLYGVAVAGALAAITAASAIGCAFLGGHLSDVHGRRPVLLVGEIGAFAGFIVLTLANSVWHSGGLTYAGYLVTVCMLSLGRPANDAMIVDVSTSDNRPTVYAINYWATNLAILLGALLGGFLYAGYFAELIYGAALLAGLVALVTWVAVTETTPNPVGGQRNEPWLGSLLRGYLTVLRDSTFARLFVGSLLVASIELQISYYVGVRLSQEFGERTVAGIEIDGVSMLGLIRGLNTLLVVCLMLVATRMFGRLSDRARLGGGIAAITAGYMVLAVSNDPWLLLAATVVFTLGEIANVPTRQTLLADIVPAEARTRYMAAYYMQFRLALVICSVTLVLGGAIGPWGMSALYGVAGMASVALCLSVLKTSRQATRKAVVGV